MSKKSLPEDHVLFHTTPQMLDDFARLTGDYNSLHLDGEYARRTSHRQRIVYGLLPVAFLFASRAFKKIMPYYFIKKITVNFLQAIDTGKKLELTIASSRIGHPHQDLEIQFTIRSQDNLQPLTTGLLLLSKNHSKENNLLKSKKTASLLSHPLTENASQFNDIETGQQATIPFCIHSSACTEFQRMISQGLAKPAQFPTNTPLIHNFLSTLMCSTLVGMRLPGRLATFVNLALNFDSSCVPHQNHRLQGEVEFKSASTQILVEKISFHTHNHSSSWAHGRLTVKMEPPLLDNISIADIKTSCQKSTLQDKVVLITGASRGIGAATAKMFSLSGARVIVNYHQGKKDALAVVEDIQKNGGMAWGRQADVTDLSQVKTMVRQAQKKFGTIHVLVNNAAADFNAVPFAHLTWEQMQNDLDVIVKGAFHCCQETLPLMLKNGGGKIINVGTIATEYPPLGQTKYVAAKSALVGLTRSLSQEFASHNIQVNMVVPSMVETDLTKSIPLVIKEKIRQKNPMGRLATTIDVAGAIVMLAGSSTSYTTGQKFFVTGGEAPLL